ncbi:MAG TPA: PEP-CTERM sorting domain-containing protein [Pyrinomonadaceae bacterium]|nr:PEP-CTERM sorting domain-containing protein [Pyrinomonadaceae bacterium]
MKQFKLLPILALIVLCFSAVAAKADPVALTTGSASTASGFGTVNLAGPDFSLSYFGEIPPGATTSFSMNTVTAGTGMVTLGGNSSSIFIGNLSFTNSLLTGHVSAYATMEDLFFGNAPVFTVDFTGGGAMSITGPQTQFAVASVPEPITLLTFGAGLGGLTLFRRRRSAATNQDAV